jgi:hypothetical protein
MYRPFTYQVVTYFPTYLPTYLYMRPIFLQNWLPRLNQRLTQLRFIHNRVAGKVQPASLFQHYRCTMSCTHTHTHTHTQCSKFWAKMGCFWWSRLQNVQTRRVLCVVSIDQICGWRRRVPTTLAIAPWASLNLAKAINWSSLTICNFSLNLPQGLCLDFFGLIFLLHPSIYLSTGEGSLLCFVL